MQPKGAADITRGKNGTKNRGEYSKTSGGLVRQGFTAPTATEEEDETKQIAAFFEGQVRGPLKKKKGDYDCSRCSQPGHNVRSCTAPLGDVEEAGVGIVPGDYVVGDCPFSLLGKRAEYEREMHL
ncbi:hypothetical protein PHYSODRAFT_295045 [Phytophthora sojae]|uniref:CCHC-type domain-containing protein n=1 Tax=Phytophthora sojae (strain P6497) TaxID=1094619 RepID=G4YLA7_PHYSP|nr:hypothetical protein PHYSODRAFT_295045 [Phytophthora sojae]EGZ30175.1 hypothetical protein PHYSODRAFT_295045 [Phytophthora sojae]|eukprot:XP_009517450.1 hypothetical protein PHYSODRAFT_295045 [Phytophthora sojae]